MRYPFVYSTSQIEDENDEDRGRLVLVIFDFEIKENMSRVSNTFRPYDDYKGENSIQEMPWLDIEVSNCNCSRYPVVGDIAVKSSSNESTSAQAASDSSESDESDGSQEDASTPTSHDLDISDDESATLFTEYFKLKGSTFHAHFQNALKRCKRLTLDKKDVAMQLLIEPANVKDENAIVVQVELDGTWQPVGYIPAVKVRKAMDAWKKNEVKTIKFKCIEWKYIYGLGEFKYVATVIVTKANRWLPTDKNYKYNDCL